MTVTEKMSHCNENESQHKPKSIYIVQRGATCTETNLEYANAKAESREGVCLDAPPPHQILCENRLFAHANPLPFLKLVDSTC